MDGISSGLYTVTKYIAQCKLEGVHKSVLKSRVLSIRNLLEVAGPYLGFFVCGGKLGFREISDQYSYKKQPSKIRHYVRKKTFSFPGGGNCPLRPPAMYGPG